MVYGPGLVGICVNRLFDGLPRVNCIAKSLDTLHLKFFNFWHEMMDNSFIILKRKLFSYFISELRVMES